MSHRIKKSLIVISQAIGGNQSPIVQLNNRILRPHPNTAIVHIAHWPGYCMASKQAKPQNIRTNTEKVLFHSLK